jgi:hypothetical protein
MAKVKKAQAGSYITTKSGRVGRLHGEYGPYVSMDTTGYGKGKKEFEVKTSYGPKSNSSKTIKREDVPEKIKEFKKGATRNVKIFEKGGSVKAKDGKWMQKAAASIKRRGTEGKCTPITKPGCTGKAKALAKTFKKIAAKRKGK